MQEDLLETFRRYIPKSMARAFIDEARAELAAKEAAAAMTPKPAPPEAKPADLKPDWATVNEQLTNCWQATGDRPIILAGRNLA